MFSRSSKSFNSLFLSSSSFSYCKSNAKVPVEAWAHISCLDKLFFMI